MRTSMLWYSGLALLMVACPRQDPFGSILQVEHPHGYMDGEPVAAGDEMARGAELSTDDTGAVDFVLEPNVARCRVFPKSLVIAGPPGGSLLSFQGGRVGCLVQGDRVRAEDVVLDARSVVVRVTDALFSITIQEDETVVEVAHGNLKLEDVQVGGANAGPSGTSLQVGPATRVRIATDGAPAVEETEPLGEQEVTGLENLGEAIDDDPRPPPPPPPETDTVSARA